MRRMMGVLFGLGFVAISAAQTPGPSIQYAISEGMVRTLRADGILIGYPDVFFRRAYREPSPWEYAVATNAAFTRLEEMSRNLSGELRSPAFLRADSKNAADALASIEDRRQKLVTYRRDVAMTQRLVGIYAHYLTQLGVDVAAAQQILKRRDTQMLAFIKGEAGKPGEALLPFDDVKRSHWAEQATTNLRREGILSGYPDGRFGGRNESAPRSKPGRTL